MRLGLTVVAAAVQLVAHWPAGRLASLWQTLATQPTTVAEKNIRYLCIEIAPAAVLGAATAFNAAFALRLGASNAEIGLLSSIPALLAVVVMIPSGRIIGRRAQRMPLVVWSLFLNRLPYLLIALAPFIPGLPHGALVVVLLIASTPAGHFFGVGWNSMLADIIPEVRRARVFAIRNIVNGVVVTAGIYVFGLWLDRIVFPINYQLMYGFGFAVALLSTYFVSKIDVPDSPVPFPQPQQAMTLQGLRTQTRDLVAQHRDFVQIIINTFLHGLGLWMIAPLYILYYVRQLGASDGWIGLNGTLANLTPIIGFYLWQRGIGHWGENRVLKWTIILIGLYPIVVGLTPSLDTILLLTAINGLITPAVNLSHFPMLLKVCSDTHRPQFIGIYSTIMNIGAFVMPLVGVYLADIFGFAPMIIAGGVLSVLGSCSFHVWALRTPDSLAARRLVTNPEQG